MAVVVDPGRLDPHHRGDEGGEKHRFEIETVEHAALYDARLARGVHLRSRAWRAHLRCRAMLRRSMAMVNISWLPPIVVEASERLVKAISLAELAKGSTVWLAVTGLSRSGKTVFTTSLIHNLLSSLHNPNRMPLLNVVGERRLIAAKLEGAKANRLPRFPYAANIEKMAGISPDWPERTTDISEIGIDVHFVPAGAVGRLLDSISGNAATLDDPHRRLSRRMAARSAAADAKLRRVVARDLAVLCARACAPRSRRDFLAFLAQHRAR